MSERQPLYNSRLTKMYIKYLRHHYPQVQYRVRAAGGRHAPYQIEDPAHWFTQEEVDRFHAVMAPSTPGIRISPRKVGQLYGLIRRARGRAKQYILGLMTPAMHLPVDGKELSAAEPRGQHLRPKNWTPTESKSCRPPSPGLLKSPINAPTAPEFLRPWPDLVHRRVGQISNTPNASTRESLLPLYQSRGRKAPQHRWRLIRNLALIAGIILPGLLYGVLSFSSWCFLTLMASISELGSAHFSPSGWKARRW